MMMLSEISKVLGLTCPKEVAIAGVSIDSRQVTPGELYLAIRGERFDGQHFIRDAVEKGAAAVVCHEAIQGVNVPQLQVPDTLEALAKIATYHRKKLNCSVIALTGSNGKTTVKEMIAAILPSPSYATPGNLNNHIGAPLSVLQLQDHHRYAVFELGANHQGEIQHTVAIVQPHVTLINNIAPAHLEGFGSIDGVACAKGEIHEGLADNGTAVINDDDAYAHFWDALLTNKKTVRFSAVKPTAVHALNIQYNKDGCGQFILKLPTGEATIKLQVPGAHNVSNALAAAACTHALGLSIADIETGLCQFSGVAGRMTVLSGKNNSIIIDDTYNANLRSSLAALEVLAKRRGRRIFVFGDMGELGSSSQSHHQDVGVAAHALGIDLLMTCGTQSQFAASAYGAHAKHYFNQDDLMHDLLNQLDANTTVLVKGSRSSKMEKIVHQLVG